MKSFIFPLSLFILVSANNYENGLRLSKNSSTEFIPKASSLLCGFLNGEASAVDKIMKNNEPVRFTVTASCVKKAIAGALPYPDNTIKNYVITESCRLSNSYTENNRVILHDVVETGEDISICGPPSDPRFRAMFLFQSPDVAAYTILVKEKGHWLFTQELSGCDIFIATKDSQSDMSLVIHANADKLGDAVRQVENLRWKEQRANQIVGSQIGYVLKARMIASPELPIPEGYEGYLQGIRNSGIKLYVYDIQTPVIQAFQFYGQYNGASWKFILKGKENGVIQQIQL